MSIGLLKQRSSWPSSFLTGLIGWIGFMIIVGIVLELLTVDSIPRTRLFLIAALAAIAQVIVLRLAFFKLWLDHSMRTGVICGGISGALLIGAAMYFDGALRQHPMIWMINGIYIGMAVGAFLSYFYRDDRRIEAAQSVAGTAVDYGRDAHWLEPFAFGAVAYVVAFVPSSMDVAVTSLVVGAMSGVVAAGVSHFFLNARLPTSALPIVLSLGAGLVQGAVSGMLFRQFQTELVLSPIAHGAIAGALTYLSTAVRGRTLAEAEATLSQ